MPKDDVSVEVAEAWGEYLEDTQNAVGPHYFEVEPSAWATLTARLREIREQERIAA